MWELWDAIVEYTILKFPFFLAPSYCWYAWKRRIQSACNNRLLSNEAWTRAGVECELISIWKRRMALCVCTDKLQHPIFHLTFMPLKGMGDFSSRVYWAIEYHHVTNSAFPCLPRRLVEKRMGWKHISQTFSTSNGFSSPCFFMMHHAVQLYFVTVAVIPSCFHRGHQQNVNKASQTPERHLNCTAVKAYRPSSVISQRNPQWTRFAICTLFQKII